MTASATNLDHKQFLSRLSHEQRQALTAKSDSAGLVTLSGHLLGILATTLWILSGAIGWPLAMVLHGIQLVFLFTLLHETVHETPFASRGLNQLVGWFCAFVILLPPVWFKYFHLAHHRHTHDPLLDPELEGGEAKDFLGYFWALTGLPVWYSQLRTLFINAFGEPQYVYVPKGAVGTVKNEARLMLVAYLVLFTIAGVAGLFKVLAMVWFVPLVLGQPFLRLYLMAEHRDCPHSSNMFENTRTTFTSAPVRWLAWNMPYHAEHHAFPTVPFHQLPNLHTVANEHLRITENGYSRFHYKTIQTLRRGIST